MAYLRVSTQEQADSGLGLQAQLKAVTDRFGPPDLVFRDEGYSGDTLDRPGLFELLATLKRGDTVVVAKLDRLSRGDVFEAAWLEKEIVGKCKASIASAAGEGTEDDSPQGRLMKDMIRAFARFELAMIRQRTSAAVKVKMARKREAGEKTGGRFAPFGYRVANADENGSPADGPGVKRLEPDPREQEAIRTMLSLRDKRATFREIGDWLTANGFPTRDGKSAWSVKVVRAILLREHARATEGLTAPDAHRRM